MLLLLEQPVRMREEARGLDELAGNSTWLTRLEWGFTESNDIRVNFDITMDEKVHEAVLVYPALYPHTPAYVRPRKADEDWSIHQYIGTGTLCLEWGPDNWHTGVTGVDLVVSTHKLLAYEKFGPTFGVATPTRHVLRLGQTVRSENQRFLVTQELQTALKAASKTAPLPLSVGTLYTLPSFVAVATQLGNDTTPTFLGIPNTIADPSVISSWIRKGWVVWCEDLATLPKPIKDQVILREFLKFQGRWPWPDDELKTGFVLLVDPNLKLRPIAIAADANGTTAWDYFPVDCTDKGEVRQPERNATLAKKKVAIVGLGSVGSKVAISLARSGLTHFLLIDDDILKPSNLSRHQLDWLSVGSDKIVAVKGAIQLVQPQADVSSRNFRLSGQESASFNTTVLEQIAVCDLVIDTTANPKVFSSISAICARRKVPLVWGEVFAGGIGALMARSRPGFDAPPLDIRNAIYSYLSRMPDAPFQHALAYDEEAEEQVFIAGDAEVSSLAASLTQFTIDALVGAEEPRFPHSAYLMGYQKAWIFEAPFDTYPVPCPRAVESPEVPDDSKEFLSALTDLMTVFKQNNADDNHPS